MHFKYKDTDRLKVKDWKTISMQSALNIKKSGYGNIR